MNHDSFPTFTPETTQMEVNRSYMDGMGEWDLLIGFRHADGFNPPITREISRSPLLTTWRYRCRPAAAATDRLDGMAKCWDRPTIRICMVLAVDGCIKHLSPNFRENLSNEFPDNFLPGFHVLFSGGGLKTFLKLWNSHKFKMHFYIFEIANLPCDSQDLMVLLLFIEYENTSSLAPIYCTSTAPNPSNPFDDG